LAAGVAVWLIVGDAVTEEGLKKFALSTGHPQAMGGGAGAALVVGGIVCIMFSMCCGGCDPDGDDEEDVWERCAQIDNPASPWAVGYRNEFCSVSRDTGRPHYFQLRRKYRSAEIAAYVLGVLLMVVLALVWPPFMLIADIFSCTTFKGWIVCIAVFGVTAAAYIGIVPPLAEIWRVCQQAYYNRNCEHAGSQKARRQASSTTASARRLER
jgi:hypothetical protein